MDNQYLDKLHREILDIMDKVDLFCKKHQLQYYLIGGTLLGAVRHGGFIPWDDDFDIAMSREDFNRFIELAASQFYPGYKLEWITTDPEYYLRFAKICKNNTKFEEEIGKAVVSDFGIFVDIFPLDRTDGYNRSVEMRRKMSKKLEVMMHLRREKQFGLKHIIAKSVPNILLHRMSSGIMSHRYNGSGEYYSNFGSQYKIQKQTMPIEWFGNGKRINFEGRQYMAPVCAEKILTSIFGADYMKLPPKDKRRTHYPLRVSFSDGTEILFEHQKSKAPIE